MKQFYENTLTFDPEILNSLNADKIQGRERALKDHLKIKLLRV